MDKWTPAEQFYACAVAMFGLYIGRDDDGHEVRVHLREDQLDELILHRRKLLAEEEETVG